MSNRIISVGFIEPKNLERDTIYVTLEKEIAGIRARAVSAKKFNYTVRAIAGNVLGETTRNITNQEGIRGHFRDYNKFLEEIVEKNNGSIDYSKAIEEGLEVYRVMRELLK